MIGAQGHPGGALTDIGNGTGMARHLRLGVNIDHVATIRNARGGTHPDPVRAAKLAVESGADGITAHLREDRRHISDEDIVQLRRILDAPLNLEMAATEDMLEIALRHMPHAVCLVPERREERTTEGGIDAAAGVEYLARYVTEMSLAGIRVALFIEPSREQVDAAAKLGAGAVEFHTGRYCNSRGEARDRELERINQAALRAPRVQDGMPCRSRPELRHGRGHRGASLDRRAEHRPFLDRRGHLSRARARPSGRCAT